MWKELQGSTPGTLEYIERMFGIQDGSDTRMAEFRGVHGGDGYRERTCLRTPWRPYEPNPTMASTRATSPPRTTATVTLASTTSPVFRHPCLRQ